MEAMQSPRNTRRRHRWSLLLGGLAAAAVAAFGTMHLVDATRPAEAPSATDDAIVAGAAEASEQARAASEQATGPTVAVFIGDSYTVGQRTELEGVGFTEMLAELRGWDAVNLAISGTGYAASHELSWCEPRGCPAYAGVLADAIAADPDIVLVSGGRNDLWLERATVVQAVEDFYTELRSTFPSQRLIVTSPLWDSSTTPDDFLTLRSTVERAAERVGAEYIDLGELFAGQPELITADGIHPTEAGLELIATSIDALLGPLPRTG